MNGIEELDKLGLLTPAARRLANAIANIREYSFPLTADQIRDGFESLVAVTVEQAEARKELAKRFKEVAQMEEDAEKKLEKAEAMVYDALFYEPDVAFEFDRNFPDWERDFPEIGYEQFMADLARRKEP